MDYFYLFLLGIFGVIALMNIVRGVRMFATAKRARILKICPTSGIIVMAVLFVGLMILGFNRLSAANEQLRKARMYENVLSAVNPDRFDEYQDATIKASPEKSEAVKPLSYTDNIVTIKKNIDILRQNHDTYLFFAVYAFIFAFFELTSVPSALLIFTEAGLLIHSFKFPEPIVAELNGGMININYKAVQLANFKKIKSFKATPKNMAVFGRFIEWDDPNAVNVQQTAPPSNMPFT